MEQITQKHKLFNLTLLFAYDNDDTIKRHYKLVLSLKKHRHIGIGKYDLKNKKAFDTRAPV
jgi:hypothetical protein